MAINKTDFKILGQYLKKKRYKAMVTQSELAKFLGCTPQFISNVERGAAPPPYQLLPKWLNLLNVAESDWIELELKIRKEQLEKIFLEHKNSFNVS